jgi:hypothetical protein
LENWALAVAREGTARRKCGVLVVRRRAGRGRLTPWLFVLTDRAWQDLIRTTANPDALALSPSADGAGRR